MYLNIAAHSPVDPFLSQPYQKEREEERNQKKKEERETESVIYWLRKLDNLAWKRKKGGVEEVVEKYSSNEQRQQRWNWPALGSLAMQLKVYRLYCCIVYC